MKHNSNVKGLYCFDSSLCPAIVYSRFHKTPTPFIFQIQVATRKAVWKWSWNDSVNGTYITAEVCVQVSTLPNSQPVIPPKLTNGRLKSS